MIYVIRLKSVSECIGIRRSTLVYLYNKDGVYDLSKMGHPISKFQSLKYNKEEITINNQSQKLMIGEEVFWYKNITVSSLGKEMTERAVLGAMLLPLDIEMVKYYEDAINNGYMFDQWQGEFEYLLALMYDYDQNNDLLASKYYNLAKEKGFEIKILGNDEE